MLALKKVLKNRADAVINSRVDTVLGNLKIFFDFLKSEPMLKSIIDELTVDTPDPEPIVHDAQTIGVLILPSSYLEKVKACFAVLQYCIEKNFDPYNLAMLQNLTSRLNAMTYEAMQILFVPLYTYIDEKIEDVDLFQYFLIRFKLNVEWFRKETLFARYTVDTSNGEDALDKALRAYLFNQGIDYPFSEPSSPSGKVDILSIVNTKPIPLEAKVYDGEGKTQSHIRQGVIQAYNYACDYNQPAAYLVVFNVSKKELVFKLRSKDIPQKLIMGEKTIFIFVITLYPHEKTASKKDLVPVVMEEDYLTNKESKEAGIT